MKIYLAACDGGGYEDTMTLIGETHRLLKMPARIIQIAGKVHFSFFWDGLGGKSINNMGLGKSSLKRNPK
jgi:hypothetical protein